MSTHTRSASPGISITSLDELAPGDDRGTLGLLAGLGDRCRGSPSVYVDALDVEESAGSALGLCSTVSRLSLDDVELDVIEDLCVLCGISLEIDVVWVPKDSASCCSR